MSFRGPKLLALAALATAALAQGRPERFDYAVRNDFFAGFSGNQEAFQRAMKTTEGVLAQNPKHAEALVWHGAGLFSLAGQAFRQQDVNQGRELYDKAVKEMDEAVALEPDNIGVRIPRGTVLMVASRNMPPAIAKPLLERALSDYEHAFELQSSYLDKLGAHPKGELLSGIAEGHLRTGDQEKARLFFERVVKELDGTPYQRRATAWLEKPRPFAQGQSFTCIGCHAK